MATVSKRKHIFKITTLMNLTVIIYFALALSQGSTNKVYAQACPPPEYDQCGGGTSNCSSNQRCRSSTIGSGTCMDDPSCPSGGACGSPDVGKCGPRDAPTCNIGETCKASTVLSNQYFCTPDDRACPSQGQCNVDGCPSPWICLNTGKTCCPTGQTCQEGICYIAPPGECTGTGTPTVCNIHTLGRCGSAGGCGTGSGQACTGDNCICTVSGDCELISDLSLCAPVEPPQQACISEGQECGGGLGTNCCNDRACTQDVNGQGYCGDPFEFGLGEIAEYTGPLIKYEALLEALYTFGLPIGLGVFGIPLIVINGYKLMTSQGEPGKVQAGKEGLTSAIIGTIFLLLFLNILRIVIRSILPGVTV